MSKLWNLQTETNTEYARWKMEITNISNSVFSQIYT
jgi:hypothetical protein